jgi:flagellar assembly factor FliW
MDVATTRFGQLACSTKDLLLCPDGLIGFEDLRLWTVLVEEQIVWLQSVEQAEIALPTVSPFSFVADYQPEISAADLATVGYTAHDAPYLLSVLSQHGSDWTLNLRAPLVVHFEQRLARQVITVNEQSLRHVLVGTSGSLRKTA